MMKALLKYFTRGLIFLVPVSVTIYIVYCIITTVGGTSWKLLDKYIPLEVPGWFEYVLGILLTVFIIMFAGFISSLFITRPIVQLFDRLIARLPLISLIYNSIKDLIGAFVGDKKKFDKPVIVNLTANGIRALGFITRQSLETFNLTDDVAVYFPQSYNFAGSVLIVPKTQITIRDDIDSSDIMTFIVSGGVTGCLNENTPASQETNNTERPLA